MAPTVALFCALLWGLHPLQLTSVLYVVQRMTSLAATFTLAAMLCWLQARERWQGGVRARSGLPRAICGRNAAKPASWSAMPGIDVH